MTIRSTASGITTWLTAIVLAGLVFTCNVASAANAGTTGLFGNISPRVSAKVAPSGPGIANGSPVIDGQSPGRIVAGSFYEFTPTASDPDGDKLTFSINKHPRWAQFDAATGRLYGTPGLNDSGKMKKIVIAVSDGVSSSRLRSFSLRVIRGKAPQISGQPPGSVVEGKSYSFAPVASDPEDQPLSFEVSNKPAWATFNKKNGRLAGTPGPGSKGVYSGISIAATDGARTSSLEPFAITVLPDQQNSAPAIGGSPVTSVQVDEAYSFRPAASDADGDTLKFSVVNLPAWASFNSTTGRISGTPRAGSEGTYSDIVVSVSDATDVAFLPMFAITVTAAPAVPPPVTPPAPTLPDPTPPPPTNRPPTISGTPATSVTVGSAYAFQPSASDPDGQPLTFLIAGQPGWADFDKASGRLSGNPTAADAGTWSNIRISVSDGQATASLGAFAIAVNQVANGAATVSWVPPTQNTDGSTITDLKGYRIKYGQAANALGNVVTIPNVGVTSAVIENLGPGTWYFGVVAYNASAVESEISELAQKTIK